MNTALRVTTCLFMCVLLTVICASGLFAPYAKWCAIITWPFLLFIGIKPGEHVFHFNNMMGSAIVSCFGWLIWPYVLYTTVVNFNKIGDHEWKL